MKKELVSVALLICSFGVNAFDYPLGVPEAWVSPDIPVPEQPEDWSVEIPNYYYVNSSNLACDDDNTYGTPTVPLCRIPGTLVQGAYVYIDGTNYNHTSTIYMYGTGTEENPVWIVGSPDNIINYKIVWSGSYMYVDGLNLRSASLSKPAIMSVRPYQGRPTDHVMIRNSSIINEGVFKSGTALSVQGDADSQMDGYIAYNNEIAYNGQWDAAAENDSHALQAGSYVSNTWFLYNYTHHNGGDGIQLSHGGVNSHHHYYAGNYSHHERENCVDIKQADDVVISSNICHDIVAVSSASGECMVVHYDPSRIWFINNDISECVNGIVSTGAFDVYVLGNDIYDIHESASESHGNISSYQTGSGVKIYSTGDTVIANNTITNSVRGISYEIGSAYTTKITGNIITGSKDGAYTGNQGMNMLFKGNSDAVKASTVENNVLYDPVRTYLDGTLYETGEELVSDSGKCTNNSCVFADPQFISETNHRLQDTSPAVDAGGDHMDDIYSTYESLYGVTIAADIDYKLRGDNQDIGAYESNTTVMPRQPIKATNIYIDVVNSQLVWENPTLDTTKIEVYKNGVLVDAEIDVDDLAVNIPGIASAVDKYTVSTSNNQGVVESVPVESDVIVVEEFNDGLNATIVDGKSWRIVRTGEVSTQGSITINSPEFLENAYGARYSKTSFTKDGEVISTGYIYVVGDELNSISGNITGSGTVDLYLMNTNYSDDVTTAELVINDSKVKMFNSGAFQQNKISVLFDGELNYLYVPTTTNAKSAIGLSGIVER